MGTIRRFGIWALHAASALASAQGVIVTIAGTDRVFPASTPALSAPLDKPECAAFDSFGNIYVCDGVNHVVVKIVGGTATVVAGTGIRTGGFSGDGGPATKASLNRPSGVVVDNAGNLYIADFNNRRIRKVNPQGIITTVAGTGECCFSGDGGPATAARIGTPSAVALDGAGNLYFSEYGAQRVRKVTVQGIISTVAGTGVTGSTGDGSLATNATLAGPSGVALDSAGNLFIAEYDGSRIRRVTPAGIIGTYAGTGPPGSFSGDGGPATQAGIANPEGIAVDNQGNLYIAARSNQRIRKVTTAGIISTVAGGGGSFGDGGQAIVAQVKSPMDVAVDAAGNLYIADRDNRRLRRVSASGVISTIAGYGEPRFAGDGGPATQALFDKPRALVFDPSGNLYVGDGDNFRVRKITPQGIVSTFAGNGQASYSGDGGPAVNAALSPPGLAAAPDGSIYIAGFAQVRKVSPAGIITTFAGNGTSLGDGGPATSAQVASSGVAVDAATGNVYLAGSTSEHRVRRVTPGGIITTVAGTGVAGSTGDGGQATAAQLNNPANVAMDAFGNLYISEFEGNRIRKVTPQGIISTVAGTGRANFTGDGGPATSADIFHPEGIVLDAAGNLYIVHRAAHRVRKVDLQGIITTIAGSGNGASFSGDGGLSTAALLNDPIGITLDGAGNVYVADTSNNRIRKILSQPPAFSVDRASLQFSASAGSAPGPGQLVTITGDITGLIWETSRVLAPPNNWLILSPNAGPIPGTLSVTATALNLPAGTYQGSIEISAAGGGAPKVISVTFTVTASRAPQLSVDPLRLSFRTLAGGTAPPSQALRIENLGSGTLTWTARAASTGGNWLAISPASSNASPASPSSLQVNVNPAGLTAGSYSGSVTVESAPGNITVPVSLLVQENTGVLLLSPSHLLFRAIQDGGVEPEQTFGVLNIGANAFDWTATTTESWLRLSPATGRSQSGASQIPFVTVSVDPTGLRAGFYAGQIRVTSTGANNSPQVLRVDLHVLAPTGRLGAVVRPTGLIFVGSAGASPSAQSVNVATTESVPLEFISQPIDGPWVTRAPDISTASRGNPGNIVVQPDLDGLAPGVYRAGLTVFTRNDGVQHPVGLLLVVRAPGSVQTLSGGPGTDCAPTKLLLQFKSVFSSFNAAASYPSTVLVQAGDDCGNPAVGGNVFLSFSNGDSTLALNELPGGLYQGGWRPINPTSTPVVVTARGSWQGLQSEPITATAQVGLNPNQQLGSLSQGGVVLGAGFQGGPLAPGSIVSLFGQKLAASENSAASLPLPRTLGGLRVLIGNQEAPLFYAGPGQINAQVPAELTANPQLQVVVVDAASGVASAPESIETIGTRPGIFTTTGSQGAILRANTPLLAEPATPVRVGDFISIYCTGLGATTPAVASGVGAPNLPPLATVPMLPSVTVDGRTATVSFAGLAPGFVGVYQVNVQVPTGVTLGDAVPVVITQGGLSSNTATIAVR